MNKRLYLVILALVAFLVMPLVLAADVCTKGSSFNVGECIKLVCDEGNAASYNPSKCIELKIQQIVDLVTNIAAILGVLAIVITGIMMAMADDPEARNKLKDKLKYIIFGLVLVFAAKFIVAMILVG